MPPLQQPIKSVCFCGGKHIGNPLGCFCGAPPPARQDGMGAAPTPHWSVQVGCLHLHNSCHWHGMQAPSEAFLQDFVKTKSYEVSFSHNILLTQSLPKLAFFLYYKGTLANCQSDQTSIKDYKQTDHSTSKQSPLQRRSKIFTYPWWIMNHFTLTECLRKIFNVRTHRISFTLPVTQVGGHRNKPSHSTAALWGAPGTRAESSGTPPNHSPRISSLHFYSSHGSLARNGFELSPQGFQELESANPLGTFNSPSSVLLPLGIQMFRCSTFLISSLESAYVCSFKPACSSADQPCPTFQIKLFPNKAK